MQMGEDKSVVNLEDYKKVSMIGRGGYGNVFKLQKLSNGKYYAAKNLIYICFNDEDEKKDFKRDLSCYQNLDNPAVVKYIGYSLIDFDGQDSIVIITKYMTNDCLSTIFRSLFKKITPEGWNNTKMIINILGISLGMKYLHDFRIIHQNLHPNNVLLDKRFYPKLSDIGLSRYNYCVGHVEISHPIYVAPEIISDDVYTYKIDVFSFGMILYGFYANSPPLVKGVTKYQISKNIDKGFRPNVEKLNNGPVKSLIIKCWSQSAEERPSFDDIIRYYIEKREDFWPEDVDEDEVEHYLNKFGLSLDPHKNTEYFL